MRFNRPGQSPLTDENWDQIKKRRFREDGTDEMQDLGEILKRVNRATRFESSGYIKQTQSNNKEVVVKVISGARGAQCVSNLFHYISREADYMKDKETLSLETEDGSTLEGKDAMKVLMGEWMKESITAQIYKKQEWKLKRLEAFDKERLYLSYKEEQGTLTKDEEERLETLNKIIKSGSYREPEQNIDLKDPANAEEKGKLERQLKGIKFAATKGELSATDKTRKAEIETALKTGTLHKPARNVSLRVNAPDDIMHILLSVGGQGHNTENAKQAARQYLQENFAAAGHRYAFVMHEDTDNLHFHVLLKAKNELTKDNIHLNKDDLFHLRQDFAYQLNKQRIEPRGATLRKDREVTLESIKKQADSLFKRASWYQDKVKKSRAVDAIGYETTALRQTERLLKLAKTEKEKVFQTQNRYEEVSKLEKSLREHKADLMNFTGPIFAKKADLTLEKLTKENQELTKKTQEILNLPDTARGGGGGLSRRKENQQKYLERHQKDIQRAISAITEANKYADPAQRQANQAMLETLKKLEKAVKPKGFRLGW